MIIGMIKIIVGSSEEKQLKILFYLILLILLECKKFVKTKNNIYKNNYKMFIIIQEDQER
jgi:hypothetical protein